MTFQQECEQTAEQTRQKYLERYRIGNLTVEQFDDHLRYHNELWLESFRLKDENCEMKRKLFLYDQHTFTSNCVGLTLIAVAIWIGIPLVQCFLR